MGLLVGKAKAVSLAAVINAERRLGVADLVRILAAIPLFRALYVTEAAGLLIDTFVAMPE